MTATIHPPAELAAYQREVLDLLFAADPERALVTLCVSDSDRERWLTYRTMTRGRMRDILSSALPRTRRHLGDEFERLVEAWLLASPPTALFMRGVVLSFTNFVEREASHPPYAGDLVRYERALLETSWRQEPNDEPVPIHADIAFERIPVLAGVHQLLALSWNVQTIPLARSDDEQPCGGDFAVVVFRSSRDGSTGTRVLDAFALALIYAIAESTRPLVESVRVAAARVGRPVDTALLDVLSAELAAWVDAGLWAGCR